MSEIPRVVVTGLGIVSSVGVLVAKRFQRHSEKDSPVFDLVRHMLI